MPGDVSLHQPTPDEPREASTGDNHQATNAAREFLPGDSPRQAALFGVQQEQETSDDYYTPAWMFEAMGLEFDVDVCAPPSGIHPPPPPALSQAPLGRTP